MVEWSIVEWQFNTSGCVESTRSYKTRKLTSLNLISTPPNPTVDPDWAQRSWSHPGCPGCDPSSVTTSPEPYCNPEILINTDSSCLNNLLKHAGEWLIWQQWSYPFKIIRYFKLAFLHRDFRFNFRVSVVDDSQEHVLKSEAMFNHTR